MKSNKIILRNLLIFIMSSLFLGSVITSIPIFVNYIGHYFEINNNLQSAIGIFLIISVILIFLYILIKLFYGLVVADIDTQELPTIILFIFMSILGAFVWLIYRVLIKVGESTMNIINMDSLEFLFSISQNLLAFIIYVFTLSIMILILFFIAWYSGSLIIRLNKILQERIFTQ